VIYPSCEFKKLQNTAVETQKCMREEAIEHFELLKQFALSDFEYQSYLRLCHDRKVKIKRKLEANASWQWTQNFIASLK
jgi:hypothetical protein